MDAPPLKKNTKKDKDPFTSSAIFATIRKVAIERSPATGKAMPTPPIRVDTVALSVCADCLMCIANGDLPTDDDPERDAASIAGVEREQASGGHIVAGGTGDDPENPDEGGFSWSSCDCCNSNLGGDRFNATLVIRFVGARADCGTHLTERN